MTVLASAIITDASRSLADTTNVHWTTTELLAYLNQAQLEIATNIPNSNAVTTTLALVSGAKQSAPADSIRIVEFIKNVSGNAVWAVERKDMDAYLPGWANDTASATVQHVMYNAEDDNKTFYVWPPQPGSGTGSLDIVYAKIPTVLAATSDAITIADYYSNALLDYVLFKAFSKDSEYGNQNERAQMHLSKFSSSTGIKYVADTNASNMKKDANQAR